MIDLFIFHKFSRQITPCFHNLEHQNSSTLADQPPSVLLSQTVYCV